MVNSCSANGCKNRNSKGSTITFHRFPLNNQSLLKLWLYQIKPKKVGWEPSKYSVLCSEHFTEDCFVTKGLANSRRTLKNDAYPTIFSMASIMCQETPRRNFYGRKSKDVVMEDDKKDEEGKDEDETEEMTDLNIKVDSENGEMKGLNTEVDTENGEMEDLNTKVENENGESKGDEEKEVGKEVTSNEETTEATKNGE